MPRRRIHRDTGSYRKMQPLPAVAGKKASPLSVLTRKQWKPMGDKISARIKMIEAGVPVVPGTQDNLKSVEEAVELCNQIGYPVMLKASMGGGGKGMRLIHHADEVAESLYNSQERIAFLVRRRHGLSGEVLWKNPHHIEFQILGDKHGNVIHLCERECSVQRRNQKIVEESPSVLSHRNCAGIWAKRQ